MPLRGVGNGPRTWRMGRIPATSEYGGRDYGHQRTSQDKDHGQLAQATIQDAMKV